MARNYLRAMTTLEDKAIWDDGQVILLLPLFKYEIMCVPTDNLSCNMLVNFDTDDSDNHLLGYFTC